MSIGAVAMPSQAITAPRFDRSKIMIEAHRRARQMQAARAALPNVFKPISYREAFATALKGAWQAAKDAIAAEAAAARYAALTDADRTARNARLAAQVNHETRATLYPVAA